MAGWMLWLSLAGASELSMSVEGDGTIVVHTTIPASEAAIRAVLADTEGSFSALSPDVLSVSAVPSGNCEKVTRSTRGIWRPMTFVALRCPTTDGWSEKLVEKGDFTAYASQWSLTAKGDSTGVTYRILTELSAPVPTSMVRQNVEKATKGLLERLADAAAGR